MCSDLGQGSRCCAGYSVIGALFTMWVGIMISVQPFFIAGIDDADEAKASAFGACGMFLFTFVASCLGIWYDSQNKSATAMEGESEADYQLAGGAAGGDFPDYGGTGSS